MDVAPGDPAERQLLPLTVRDRGPPDPSGGGKAGKRVLAEPEAAARERVARQCPRLEAQIVLRDQPVTGVRAADPSDASRQRGSRGNPAGPVEDKRSQRRTSTVMRGVLRIRRLPAGHPPRCTLSSLVPANRSVVPAGFTVSACWSS